jgi:hypothetical protein
MDLLTLKTLGPGAFRGSPYKWTPSGPVLREPPKTEEPKTEGPMEVELFSKQYFPKYQEFREVLKKFKIKKETKSYMLVTRPTPYGEDPEIEIKLTRSKGWWKTNNKNYTVFRVKGETKKWKSPDPLPSLPDSDSE